MDVEASTQPTSKNQTRCLIISCLVFIVWLNITMAAYWMNPFDYMFEGGDEGIQKGRETHSFGSPGSGKNLEMVALAGQSKQLRHPVTTKAQGNTNNEGQKNENPHEPEREVLTSASSIANASAAAAAATISPTPGPMKIHFIAQRESFAPIAEWRSVNPSASVLFHQDTSGEDYVRAHRPSALSVYQSMVRIEKVDYYRYLLLATEGGVYADSDVHCVQPVSSWLATFDIQKSKLSDFDFVVGIEFASAQNGYSRIGPLPFQINQFVIYASPGSVMMERILIAVEESVRTIPFVQTMDVLERSGPAIFTKAILDEIALRAIPAGKNENGYPNALAQMSELNKNGQIVTLVTEEGRHISGVILPYRAFSFHPGHQTGDKGPVLTQHMFAGSWK